METVFFFPLPVIASVRVSMIKVRTDTIDQIRLKRTATAITFFTFFLIIIVWGMALLAILATPVTPSAPSQNKRSFSSVLD